MKTILIKHARVIDPGSDLDRSCDILIADGKIKALGEDLCTKAEKSADVIDGAGLIAAPGLVDMHVHLRDPGQTDKEDIHSGCRAAAAGGVTSMLCMPNTVPAIDSPETVHSILECAKTADARVYVCGSITKGLRGEERSDYAALKRAGAIALSDDGRPVLHTSDLLAALQEAEALGMLLTAHCEDLTVSPGGLVHRGEASERLGVMGIGRAAEDCGTAREIVAAASIDARLHICHVSTKGAVALVRDAKRRGLKVTAETAPHYLLLTDADIVQRDADYRMSPPLRTEEDRQAVIAALKDGTIDAIATDHAPHTVEEKKSFEQAPNGVIGMETALSAVLTALEGVLQLPEILRLMSVNPAKLLNIPAGSIRTGASADLVLFDEHAYWQVDPARLHGKSRNTPFKGMRLKGRVVYTIFNGRIVYVNDI